MPNILQVVDCLLHLLAFQSQLIGFFDLLNDLVVSIVQLTLKAVFEGGLA